MKVAHTPANLLDTANQLEWSARKLSQGLQLGGHRSARVGDGLEFAHYRAYSPGDDLRQLDWKLYAKTEKFYIKQAPLPAQQHLHCMIDGSPSMNYGEDGLSKKEYAILMASALTHIFMRQGDDFSWQLGQNRFKRSSGKKKWHHSTNRLYQEKVQVTESIKSLSINEGVAIWFTDLYIDREQIDTILRLNNNPKIEILLINLKGKKESELDFQNHSSFRDLESGEKVMLHVKNYQSTYSERLNTYLHSVEQLCHQYQVPFQQLFINEPPKISLVKLTQFYNSLSI